MKIVTLLNWIIVGLYGLSILYLVITNNNPNNDAAGRGMISGSLVLLLIFGAILTGLNLTSSRTAKFIALVIGGLPIVFMSIYLIGEYWGPLNAEKEAIHDTDSQAMQQAIQKPTP